MAQLRKPLKILQVIDRLDAGGAERVMVDLANILSQKGHKVTTLAILDHGPLRHDLDKDVTQINLNRTGRFSIGHMKKLRREAKKSDILHVHMRHNLKYVWLTRLLFPFGAKIIFHDHYGKINIDQSVSTTLKWALRHCFYVGVSKQLAEWAIEKVGLPENKVFHLYNIVVRKEITQTAKKPTESLNLVMVSNIRKEKNIGFAVKILNGLSKSEDVNLTIYGQIVDQGYYDQLKTIIMGMGLSKRIRFVHDCVDIQPELPQYDLALHTAKSETGPLVLIEYLCQGLPFVSFRTGEVIDQLQGEVPEFIMDHFEVSSWLQRIERVRSLKLEVKLTDLYRKYYSAENYYQKCMEIYGKSLTY